MLNTIELGSPLPIHRHPTKDESFVILRGKVRATTHNDDGSIIEDEVLSQESGNYGVDIPDDIEAVLIDGVEDAMVYYDPKNIMATYVEPGQTVEPHITDYSYFMEHFKRCYDVNKKSYYDLVKESGFQFVHEVQHWLKDKKHNEGLEVHHSIRPELKIDITDNE